MPRVERLKACCVAAQSVYRGMRSRLSLSPNRSVAGLGCKEGSAQEVNRLFESVASHQARIYTTPVLFSNQVRPSVHETLRPRLVLPRLDLTLGAREQRWVGESPGAAVYITRLCRVPTHSAPPPTHAAMSAVLERAEQLRAPRCTELLTSASDLSTSASAPQGALPGGPGPGGVF